MFFMWDPIGNKLTYVARLYGLSWHYGILVSLPVFMFLVYCLINLCDMVICEIEYHDYCICLSNLPNKYE